MTSNSKTALLTIAVLGLLAGGLWWLRQQPRRPTEATAARQAAAAKGGPETAPVAPPVGATATGLAEPGTVTVVGGPPGDFVVRELQDGEQAMRYAIEMLGPQAARTAVQQATWRLVISGSMQRTITVAADTARGLVIRDDESGDETGWLDGSCWAARGDVVVPCPPIQSGIARAVWWMLRAQVVAPLVASPWKVAKATAFNEQGQLTNTMQLEPNGAVAAAPGMVLVHTDARSRRVVRLDVTNTRVETERAVVPQPRAIIEFSDPLPFGALSLSASAVMRLGDYEPLDELHFRLIGVRPGASLPSKARTPQWPKELQVGTRPAAAVMLFEVGAREKIPEQLLTISQKIVSPVRLQQLDIVEAQAPAGTAAGTGVQLWMVPRNPIVLTLPAVAPHVRQVPAELAVVRRYVSVPSDQVPAEVAATLQLAEKAGHKPLPDHRTTVTYLASGDGTPRMVIAEIALPIAPP